MNVTSITFYTSFQYLIFDSLYSLQHLGVFCIVWRTHKRTNKTILTRIWNLNKNNFNNIILYFLILLQPVKTASEFFFLSANISVHIRLSWEQNKPCVISHPIYVGNSTVAPYQLDWTHMKTITSRSNYNHTRTIQPHWHILKHMLI